MENKPSRPSQRERNVPQLNKPVLDELRAEIRCLVVHPASAEELHHREMLECMSHHGQG